MMDMASAANLVKRIQTALAMLNQEELLEYVALSLTEDEFDEVCQDYNFNEGRDPNVKVRPGVAMLICGMPVLIRSVRA
jgi:hypothetical protein